MPAPRSTLQIVTGDSPYALLDRLDADACAHGLSPFDDETIVVQSRGMERWIRQELAVRRGIAAALDVFFPVGFCGRLAAARPADPPDPAFEREALTWRLTSILGALDVHASETWAPLRPYLDGGRARRSAAEDVDDLADAGDAAGRFALARRIATLFDNYRLYRPHLLLSWEGEPVPPSMRAAVAAADAGVHAPWQRALWQQLTGGARPRHFARWLLETTTWLERATTKPADVPPCVAVFGISTLPPAFVDLLHALARFVPVTAYVLTPSAHGHADPALRHPLESQLGATSRELLTLLAREDDASSPLLELALTPAVSASAAVHAATTATPHAADTTLARLQTALRAGRTQVAPTPVDARDRSLLVHDCHSPVRELEVLHDQLLDAFAADPTLRPHDVLVMVPDVDRYASLAAMVFGSGRRDAADSGGTSARPAIPWRVADRAPDRASAPASAFVQLLALVDSRFHASAVLDLLAGAPVRRAAGLDDTDIDAITRWVQDARIHWGTDGLMRARHHLPSLEEHTWRLGIDRLVAGHATGAREALVLGVLPTAGDTGGDAHALGQFVEWVEQLALRAESLSKPRSLLAWSLAFDAAFDWLVAPDGANEEAACERVHRDIARLRGRTPDDDDAATTAPADAGTSDTEVTFDVARRWLLEALASERQDAGFLSGGLTICAMKPMRAIPFRVIAMLGLDDRAFPRRERRPAFDLQGVAPVAGDRDARADDRQLMLDTLLCAGERLHLSWVGRSQANNAAIAPSIVVSELLDQLDVMFTAAAGDAPARAQVLVTHALQPFSVSYFDDSAPHRFTFDARWRPPTLSEGARAAATVFCTDTTSAIVNAEPLHLTLTDFIDAWTDPARWHARHVLRLRLTGVDDGVDDVEPLVVDSLQRMRLLAPMLARAMRGSADAGDEAREAMLLANGGDLPPGALTALWTGRLHEQRQLVVNEAWRDVPADGARAPLSVQLRSADWTITGTLDGQVEGGQRFVRGARIGDRERIRAWLMHLVYCAAGGTGETRMVGIKTERGAEKADVVRFAFVPDAMAQIDTLMRHVRALHVAPLPFFPRSAFAWWGARDNVNAQQDTIDGFTAESMYASPEAGEPYVALLWRGRSPLEEQWDRFVAITTDLCEPMRTAGGIK